MSENIRFIDFRFVLQKSIFRLRLVLSYVGLKFSVGKSIFLPQLLVATMKSIFRPHCVRPSTNYRLYMYFWWSNAWMPEGRILSKTFRFNKKFWIVLQETRPRLLFICRIAVFCRKFFFHYNFYYTFLVFELLTVERNVVGKKFCQNHDFNEDF